jgi:serine/threonine protein kinase
MPEPPPALRTLTRENLARHVVQRLSNEGNTRADILLVEIDGVRAVVKDYAARAPRFRQTVGRWLVAREVAAYADLGDAPGVPRFCCRIDPFALAMEYVDGKSCADYTNGELGAEFYGRLREVIEEFHRRGLAHADLKKTSNIIVRPNGEPAIVDWASVIRRRTRIPGAQWFARWLYGRFADQDVKAIAKLKRRLSPELLSPEEERFLNARPFPEKQLRWMIRQWRGVVRRLAGRGG